MSRRHGRGPQHMSARRPSGEQQIIRAEYSGPLPPASQLERYDMILPGAAERIMAQWERQSSHRQELETKVVEGNLRAQVRGQWFSLAITLGIVGLAAYLFTAGMAGWALAAIISDLVALVAINKGTRHRQGGERQEKDRVLRGN